VKLRDVLDNSIIINNTPSLENTSLLDNSNLLTPLNKLKMISYEEFIDKLNKVIKPINEKID